jgi:phosphatidyl-myo-inositol dimannoside synthase
MKSRNLDLVLSRQFLVKKTPAMPGNERYRKRQLPKALVITRNLPPLVGGMERLVWHIVDELRQNYRVCVIGPEGCRNLLPHGVDCSEVPLTPLFRFLFLAQIAAIGSAFRRKPRFVMAGSGLTAPLVWLVSRIFRARCFVYLHGLDIEANHKIYRMFWRPFFRKFDGVMVNSHFTKKLAIQIGISKKRIRVLHPGVTLPDPGDADTQRREFRERHNLEDSHLLLYVGRLTARKGFAFFCKDILPHIVEKHPSVKTVVVGDEPESALLQAKGIRAHIEAILTENGLKKRVLFLGELAQDDPELSAAYFSADVLVFPVQQRKNDNEGFGMVAIEAAAHGLPTVAFAAGGVTDAVANDASGKLVASGDNQAFSEAVIDLLQKPSYIRKGGDIRAFAAEFAWPEFGKRLRSICNLEFTEN